MTITMQKVALGLLVFLVFACEKDNVSTNDPFVVDELQEYFEQFTIEGQARGLEIDLVEANIEGYIQNIVEQNVVGQCSYNADEPRRVLIDRAYWRRASDLEREMVVFHELGHCFLSRGHLDEADSEGNCLSIMHSGTSGCNLNYATNSRDEFLDELFE